MRFLLIGFSLFFVFQVEASFKYVSLVVCRNKNKMQSVETLISFELRELYKKKMAIGSVELGYFQKRKIALDRLAKYSPLLVFQILAMKSPIQWSKSRTWRAITVENKSNENCHLENVSFFLVSEKEAQFKNFSGQRIWKYLDSHNRAILMLALNFEYQFFNNTSQAMGKNDRKFLISFLIENSNSLLNSQNYIRSVKKTSNKKFEIYRITNIDKENSSFQFDERGQLTSFFADIDSQYIFGSFIDFENPLRRITASFPIFSEVKIAPKSNAVQSLTLKEDRYVLVSSSFFNGLKVPLYLKFLRGTQLNYHSNGRFKSGRVRSTRYFWPSIVAAKIKWKPFSKFKFSLLDYLEVFPDGKTIKRQSLNKRQRIILGNGGEVFIKKKTPMIFYKSGDLKQCVLAKNQKLLDADRNIKTYLKNTQIHFNKRGFVLARDGHNSDIHANY